MTATAVAEKYTNLVWNEKDLGAIDAYFGDSVIIHSPLGDFKGKEKMREVVQTWLSAFPDLAVKTTHVICQGDLVVLHWETTGTHRGEFKGIQPSGNKVQYSGVTIYRIANNAIIEYWAYLQMHHLLSQLV